MGEGKMALPSLGELAPILHRCRKLQKLEEARSFHAQMCKYGLNTHAFLGNRLVSMFVDVGSTCDAERIFNALKYPDNFSWNGLISAYVQCGKEDCALFLYQKMQQDVSSVLSQHTLVGLLQACGKLKNFDYGCKLSDVVIRSGMLCNRYVGTALVDMYAKCGSLVKAQEVFDELLARDSVTWNALIAGYADHGYGKEALECFKQMQHAGFPPDSVTYVCTLKACGIVGTAVEGFKIHAEVAKDVNLEYHVYVGNALVDMYCKSGLLDEAHDMFDSLPVRDVVSFNALLAGYCKQGFLARAQQIFDNLLVRDTVSWNVMINGYVDHGESKSAVTCFKKMQSEGVSPSRVTYVCILKASSSLGDMNEGEAIYAEVARVGLLKRDAVLCSSLVDMYAKCNSIVKAHEVFVKHCNNCVVAGTALIAGYAQQGLFLEAQRLFDNLPVRNVVSWNTLIAGYTEYGLGHEALKCYDLMQLESVSPNAVTFVSTFKACASVKAIDKGLDLHLEVSQNGLLDSDVSVGNTLLDMYIKCDDLAKAQDVFDKLLVRDAVSWNSLIAGYAEKGLLAVAQDLFDKLAFRDVISWNALITGYSEHGQGEEALKCLEQMLYEGIPPDVVTYICCLKACGSVGALKSGELLHTETAKRGLLEKDLTLCNTLIDMYAKCGHLTRAQSFLDDLSVRDVVSWNALISGYVEHGHDKEALKCFEAMQTEGFSPNVVTFTCILKAYGNVGAVDKVQELHAEICRKGSGETDLVIGNTLIYVCVKCGLLSEAQEVFNKLPVRDVVSWNALIAGGFEFVENEGADFSFSKMTGEGIEPNLITFLNIIKNCSVHGSIEKTERYFEVMNVGFGIPAASKHRNCMADLLGRTGHLDKAIEILSEIFHTNPVACHAVLDSCRKSGNTELARHAFGHAMQLDENDAAAYALMSSVEAGFHIL